MIMLIAMTIVAPRVFHATHRYYRRHKTHRNKKPRKLFHTNQLTNMSTELNTNIDVINHAYEEIEGVPLGQHHSSILGHKAQSPGSEKFRYGLHDIDGALKDSNNLITRYINHYVLTPKIVKGYDKYSEKQHGMKHHKQNDILIYMAKYVKDIKMKKKEENFFTAVNRYHDAITDQLKQISNSPNKAYILKKIRIKLSNANRLVTFVRKYMFFVTHLNTDYHFVDHDFAKYGAKEAEVAEHHTIKYKGFAKHNDHVPLTIVISKEDLQRVRGVSTSNGSGVTTTTESSGRHSTMVSHASGRDEYISKQLSDSQGEFGDIVENGVNSNTASNHDIIDNDDQELTLLAREKEENGLGSDPNQTIDFNEPKAKLPSSLNSSDLSILDPQHNDRVNKLLHLENDRPSELNNLLNWDNNTETPKNKIDLYKDVYQSMRDSQPEGLDGQLGIVKHEDAYLQKLLNLHQESDELHVNSQASPNENSQLELIRQPTIESIHDHGYITVINSDDDRNTRLSKKSEFDKTPLGEESRQIVDSYNKLANLNTQDVNGYIKQQDQKTQNYFQPIINDTFKNLDQPIIQPRDLTQNIVPYYFNNTRPSYAIDSRIGQGMQMKSSVQVSNQGSSVTSQAQARRLFSPAGDYWTRKAESAFKNLLSGRFRI